VTVTGTLAPLSEEEAAEINQELNKTRELIMSADFLRGTTMIF
jgi:hypothetical protein